MERRFSMKRWFSTALALVACAQGYSAHAERAVVLVTNSSCARESMTMLEVRKAYFGLMIGDDKKPVVAFRLNDDEELTQIFYQTVVAMSEASYEWRLLSNLLKRGIPRPRVFDDADELLLAVKDSNCAIAYVWGQDARGADGIKELRLLWRGE
jgi:hypothetical protein